MSRLNLPLVLLLLLALPALAADPVAPESPPPVPSLPDPLPPDPALPEDLTLPPEPGSAPTVSIRTIENGDVVEEYRQDGRLTSIRVRPLRGPAYTVHDSNGDGRLDRKDAEGPVAPVYWTLYEWD